jgi:hypothetical protein
VREVEDGPRWPRRTAGQPGPSDGALGFLYPLLARIAFVVERDNVLGRPRHVGEIAGIFLIRETPSVCRDCVVELRGFELMAIAVSARRDCEQVWDRPDIACFTVGRPNR